MSYAIVKSSRPSRSLMVPSRASFTRPSPRKIFVKNDDSLVRVIDDDGYISDSPVIIKQKPSYVVPKRASSINKYGSSYVYYEEPEIEDDEIVSSDGDQLYMINGKYYKAKAPTTSNKMYKQIVQSPRENYTYIVENNSDEEVIYDDYDDDDFLQKKVIMKPQRAPKEVIYVDDAPRPAVVKVKPTYQAPVYVKPTSVVRRSASRSSLQKPLERIIMTNRSRPRNNHRKELEKIEIRDKPMPNRSVIYGGTIVYK